MTNSSIDGVFSLATFEDRRVPISSFIYIYIHTQTHTHTYIYIYILIVSLLDPMQMMVQYGMVKFPLFPYLSRHLRRRGLGSPAVRSATPGGGG